MIFTVANIQATSDIRFDVNERELQIVYTNPHPGNQRRTLQVRFGPQATRELVEAVRALDAQLDSPLDRVLSSD
ncbi:hypothetical protein E8E95_16270 [Pseudomonas sp. BN414]|uniref:hypothetical protein n=1 Tax=unclassified Pseudomonas TaxID=196821 RepID=UPI0024556E66|nr:MULTISPECIES: hypothetical protein [unclassified Pseudomonas]MDH4561309.1 hypothetical protein [Pseudomonas sp. BN411]MDH4568241.1 hypothetical protein [Pseudomonas sp. BN414]MDH4656999.1 hypothetical protein [Pseudomonas sp. BN606]